MKNIFSSNILLILREYCEIACHELFFLLSSREHITDATNR